MHMTNQKIYFIPDELLEVQNLLGEVDGVVCAGGAARSCLTKESVNDIDLFVVQADELKYDDTKNNLIELLKLNCELIFECPQGLLYSFKTGTGLKIQIVCKRNYSSIHDLFDSFDFTLCQFAFLIKYNIAVWTDNAQTAVERNELRVHRVTYPVATMKRMTKYISYGYKPHNTFFLEMFEEINNYQVEEEADLALYID